MTKNTFKKSNPFTFAHCLSEKAFLNLPDYLHTKAKKGASIVYDTKTLKAGQELDVYMDIRQTHKEDFKVQRFFIGKQLYMSTVPREFASQWVPLMQASGKVGVAGLGMGYFALRCASFDDVTEVVVHELDPAVIETFKHIHKGRPELKKIRIEQGDFKKLWNKEPFDYYYNDIYKTIGVDEQQLEHFQASRKINGIKKYWYWGFDQHLYECLTSYRGTSALHHIINTPYLKELFNFRHEVCKFKDDLTAPEQDILKGIFGHAKTN